MKFSAAKALLINLLGEGVAHLMESDDEVELTIQVAQSREVALLLVYNLLFERKRNHVALSSGFYLYCPRLLTFSGDEATIDSMPEAMRLKVVALRSRLSGRVALPTQSAGDTPLRATDHIDDWSEDEVIEYVLTGLAVSEELSKSPLPASSAEELLLWAKQREAQTENQNILRVAHAWSVAPSVEPRQAQASAA